jgi:hypothetical protein
MANKDELLLVTKGIRMELYEKSEDIVVSTAGLCDNILIGAKHDDFIMRSARNMVQKEGLISQTSDVSFNSTNYLKTKVLSTLEVTTNNIESEYVARTILY